MGRKQKKLLKQKEEDLIQNPRFTYNPSKGQKHPDAEDRQEDDSQWPSYRKNTVNSRLKKREKSPLALSPNSRKNGNPGYHKFIKDEIIEQRSEKLPAIERSSSQNSKGSNVTQKRKRRLDHLLDSSQDSSNSRKASPKYTIPTKRKPTWKMASVLDRQRSQSPKLPEIAYSQGNIQHQNNLKSTSGLSGSNEPVLSFGRQSQVDSSMKTNLSTKFTNSDSSNIQRQRPFLQPGQNLKNLRVQQSGTSQLTNKKMKKELEEELRRKLEKEIEDKMTQKLFEVNQQEELLRLERQKHLKLEERKQYDFELQMKKLKDQMEAEKEAELLKVKKEKEEALMKLKKQKQQEILEKEKKLKELEMDQKMKKFEADMKLKELEMSHKLKELEQKQLLMEREKDLSKKEREVQFKAQSLEQQKQLISSLGMSLGMKEHYSNSDEVDFDPTFFTQNIKSNKSLKKAKISTDYTEVNQRNSKTENSPKLSPERFENKGSASALESPHLQRSDTSGKIHTPSMKSIRSSQRTIFGTRQTEGQSRNSRNRSRIMSKNANSSHDQSRKLSRNNEFSIQEVEDEQMSLEELSAARKKSKEKKSTNPTRESGVSVTLSEMLKNKNIHKRHSSIQMNLKDILNNSEFIGLNQSFDQDPNLYNEEDSLEDIP